MRFLWISEAGDGMGLALRVAEEGNDVYMWIRNPEQSRIGDEIVEKTHNYWPDLGKGLVAVADCTGSGPILDVLRGGSYHCVGGSQIADRLETERDFTNQVFKQCGIPVPKTKHFDDWDSGLKYVQQHDARMVFKPGADLSGNLPSYVSKDQEDLYRMVQFYRGQVKGPADFELQEFLEGICISTECWFNGHDFIRPFNHTLEEKSLMAGNRGPSGGCTGNVVWACDGCEVCGETVLKLEKFLKEVQYCGPIDVNAVVNGDGCWGLEFTPRFGYDASPTLFWKLHNGELGKFLSDTAQGLDFSGDFKDGFAAGVKLSLPPWPSEEFHGPEGLPVVVKASDQSSFYPYQLLRPRDDPSSLETAGCQGIIGIALGYGDDVKSSMDNALKVAERVKVPNLQFRDDLGKMFIKQLDTIRDTVGAVHV